MIKVKKSILLLNKIQLFISAFQCRCFYHHDSILITWFVTLIKRSG